MVFAQCAACSAAKQWRPWAGGFLDHEEKNFNFLEQASNCCFANRAIGCPARRSGRAREANFRNARHAVLASLALPDRAMGDGGAGVGQAFEFIRPFKPDGKWASRVRSPRMPSGPSWGSSGGKNAAFEPALILPHAGSQA